MKRTLLVVFLSLMAVTSFSQKNVFVGLYGGAGMATANNYNVAPTLGFEFRKGIATRTSLGVNLFYQTYSLYYDNEQNSAKHGTGNAGAILRHASSFVFLAPEIEHGIGWKENLHIYANVGVGFKINGFDSLRKWDHSYNNPSVNNFDSSLDLSENINSMLFRIGMGFKQFLKLGPHWSFVVSEDFGFLVGGLTKSGDPYNPSRTQYTPQKLNPGYISLRIGITHTKFR